MKPPDQHSLTLAYALPPLLSVEAITPHEYRLVTAEGRYTLTILPQDSPLDGHYYQHWLLLALAHFNLSFMIPTPLRDRKGATFHRCSTGEQWVIAPCLEGQAIVPNDLDNAYSMGAALAELHHALEQIPPMPRPDVSPYTLHNRVLPNLHKPMPHEPAQLGLSMSKESQHRLRRFVVQAKNYQESLPMPGQDLRWHITHGSFSGYNLRYNGERVVGVEDFSEARPDYRALEFASALLWVASDLGPMFWGTARAFVEGYAAFVHLTRAEIDLIPRLIVAMQVDRVLSFVGASPQQATSALRTHEDISAWLESEQPRLEAMLRGVFLGE